MSETSAEQQEGLEAGFKPVDILNKNYQFHWTPIGKIEKVLNRGIYSRVFANRIRDNEFHQRTSPHLWPPEKDVYFTPFSWKGLPGSVGIAIGGIPIIENAASLRVAPRKFVGIVVKDSISRETCELLKEKWHSDFESLREQNVPEQDTLREVGLIAEVIKQAGEANRLGVYGMSGDLYSPKRMSHDEIVQVLAERAQK
ncbi:hypothetical protein HY382_00995 [Candidatus Curtissbacteria bacterium]|nr:hypothetical protein [Candidatus Curtissbacteria bacterium]